MEVGIPQLGHREQQAGSECLHPASIDPLGGGVQPLISLPGAQPDAQAPGGLGGAAQCQLVCLDWSAFANFSGITGLPMNRSAPSPLHLRAMAESLIALTPIRTA